MRTVELSAAKGSLSEIVRKARGETLVLTRRGKAVAAVMAVDEEDYFSMRLATNPEFIAIIERGRAQYKAEGGISLEGMRRKYGLESRPKRKPLRKTG